METFSWFNLPKYEGVSLPVEDKVERAGYLSADAQIEQLRLAGMRLRESRQANGGYQFPSAKEASLDAKPGRLYHQDRAAAIELARETLEEAVEFVRGEAVKENTRREAEKQAANASEEVKPEESSETAPKGD